MSEPVGAFDVMSYHSVELIQPKKRLPTDAEVAMAGISSTIAALANKVPKLESAESESVGTVTIAKQSTLGITIRGGTNKPEGPHIYIDRVISGLDVANVSYSTTIHL